MLQFFRNNQLHTAFLVLIFALPFFWVYAQNETADLSGLPEIFIALNTHKLLAFSVFAVLISVQAFWLNYIVNYFRIGKKTSFYTALIFLLSSFSFEAPVLLSPALFSNLLITASVHQFLIAYDNKNSVKEVFNAALFSSAAVIVNPQVFFYLLFALSAWMKVRSYGIKEFAVLLIGLITPFYLFGTYMYLNDGLLSWLQYLGAHFGAIKSDIRPSLSLWVSISVIGLLLMLGIVNYRGLKIKTNIREQKYIDLLFFLLFFSAFFWVANTRIGYDSLRMLTLPLSIFISLNFQALKNEKLSGFLFLLLIAAAVFTNFGDQILLILGI